MKQAIRNLFLCAFLMACGSSAKMVRNRFYLATAQEKTCKKEYFLPHPDSLPFSKAVRQGDTIYVSGQIGYEGSGLVKGFKAQLKVAMKNLEKALKTAGSSLKDVTKVTAFLENMENYDTFNKIYKEYFSLPYPARSTVQVAALPLGALFEIEAIATVAGCNFSIFPKSNSGPLYTNKEPNLEIKY